MAFTNSNLHLHPGAVGDLNYIYDAGSDTMATVLAAGYFNNTDDNLNLAAEDRIWCQCSDGNMVLRVTAVSSGSVTTQFAGGNMPIQTMASGTAGVKTLTAMGYYEVGSGISTASKVILPAPYPGAEFQARKGSGTTPFLFYAGTATAVVYDTKGNRAIRLTREGESFHLVGSSTTRWRIRGMEINATGASASAGAGATAYITAS